MVKVNHLSTARFPDGNVRINQFEELDDAVKA